MRPAVSGQMSSVWEHTKRPAWGSITAHNVGDLLIYEGAINVDQYLQSQERRVPCFPLRKVSF